MVKLRRYNNQKEEIFLFYSLTLTLSCCCILFLLIFGLRKRKTKGEYLPINDLLAKRIFDTCEIKLEIYVARNPNILYIQLHIHTHKNTQIYERLAGLVAGGRGVLHRMNCDAIIVGSKSVDQHNNNNSMQQ